MKMRPNFPTMEDLVNQFWTQITCNSRIPLRISELDLKYVERRTKLLKTMDKIAVLLLPVVIWTDNKDSNTAFTAQ